MDYQAFFADIARWIHESNQQATKYGIRDERFWSWVSQSIGQMCDKYNNAPLVKKQMAMLYEWLEDIYNGTH